MHRSLHLPLLAALLMLCAAAAASAQAGYTPHTLSPSLRDQAASALQKGDHEAAAALYERWLEADPRDNSSWYNLACLRALSGDTARAIDAFERSVDAGWRDATHARRDSDLDTLRSNARFAAALERIGSRSAARGPRGFIRRFAAMRSRGTYIVMLPPDYETSSKEYPVCVILHGAGSTELAHGRLADTMGREGVIYIAPRAPYPIAQLASNGTLGWTSRPTEELAPDDPNRALVISDYVDWILTCIDEVQSTYRARKGKVHLYGHSQGGAFANIVALTHPDRVATYYSQAASLPSAELLSVENARRMKASGVRAWLIHGEGDAVVPPSTSRTIDSVLAEAGVERRLRMVMGDHGFNAEILGDIRTWIAREVRTTR